MDRFKPNVICLYRTCIDLLHVPYPCLAKPQRCYWNLTPSLWNNTHLMRYRLRGGLFSIFHILSYLLSFFFFFSMIYARYISYFHCLLLWIKMLRSLLVFVSSSLTRWKSHWEKCVISLTFKNFSRKNMCYSNLENICRGVCMGYTVLRMKS